MARQESRYSPRNPRPAAVLVWQCEGCGNTGYSDHYRIGWETEIYSVDSAIKDHQHQSPLCIKHPKWIQGFENG